MIIVIRISGMVKVPKKVTETLHRLRLRRKYVAVILEDSATNLKLLRKIRDYVAYGTISQEMLEKLVALRGKEVTGDKNKSLEIKLKKGKKKLKPFFRLHPPRGGIESKRHAGVGKGVLGDNKEKINELLARML